MGIDFATVQTVVFFIFHFYLYHMIALKHPPFDF